MPHNQLLSDDTYAYDARGNRVSRTDRATGAVETYSYDSQNRLIGWADGVSVISYAHDALDRRIAVTVDGVTESFVHDPWSPYSSIANDVLLDFEDGALMRRWLHGPEVDEPLAYERYAGTTAGGTGTALELFRNRLGSVILAVSVSTGAVAAEYDYDYDSFGQRTLVQGTEEVRYGFTAREHDPLTGRFLQRDPIGFASGDLNLYAYVENDPYNFTDPSGLVEGSVTTARSAGMSSGLGGIFSGVLGLANNIRTALMSSTALTSVTTAANIADRAVSCGSAVANAASGNVGGAAADAAGCVAGRTLDQAFERAGEFGIDTYRNLRQQVLARHGTGSGLEVHHLVEQRFRRQIGMHPNDMPSIVVTRAEHQPLTNDWRGRIPYGDGTSAASRERILDTAETIYSDFPEIIANIRGTFGP
ncbi:RHS repeat-associated core domain-containing protein [Boseongicola sp. H5]|uniref:RHS repeat-associated core domain-containing protein n=1 Tax=Boseongicola sp. H5 TaxID=2763261 RepID=UPI001D0A0240|nr:RHS repeat-associated core domain-containing protein [Boseongicola sp. H5]